MDADLLRNVKTIQDLFGIAADGMSTAKERHLLSMIEQADINAGDDIVTFGADCDDGMYIILEGTAEVFDAEGNLINTLGTGDFIGERGLINDEKRSATVRAASYVSCANISKKLFYEIFDRNPKIYRTFINTLYTKTSKLVRQQERIRTELEIASRLQEQCLEKDFAEFNSLSNIRINAMMRPAKEVSGDFYDVFMTDENHLCFLVADVSGKGVPAALFMIMAKTHIRDYAMLGMPLNEVCFRVNNQLCHKNNSNMFVTAFICLLDIRTGVVSYINAGHNRPYILNENNKFDSINARVDMAFGLFDNINYRQQELGLMKGGFIYLYTDGVTEALNSQGEFFGDERLKRLLDECVNEKGKVDAFLTHVYKAVQDFAGGQQQADDITMLCVSSLQEN